MKSVTSGLGRWCGRKSRNASHHPWQPPVSNYVGSADQDRPYTALNEASRQRANEMTQHHGHIRGVEWDYGSGHTSCYCMGMQVVQGGALNPSLRPCPRSTARCSMSKAVMEQSERRSRKRAMQSAHWSHMTQWRDPEFACFRSVLGHRFGLHDRSTQAHRGPDDSDPTWPPARSRCSFVALSSQPRTLPGLRSVAPMEASMEEPREAPTGARTASKNSGRCCFLHRPRNTRTTIDNANGQLCRAHAVARFGQLKTNDTRSRPFTRMQALRGNNGAWPRTQCHGRRHAHESKPSLGAAPSSSAARCAMMETPGGGLHPERRQWPRVGGHTAGEDPGRRRACPQARSKVVAMARRAGARNARGRRTVKPRGSQVDLADRIFS